jgi:hypothetical protein
MCVSYGLIGLPTDEGSTSSTNSKDDEQESQEDSNFSEEQEQESEEDKLDYNLYSPITGARPKFSNLKPPPPVAPHHSRRNSGCNTQSRVRYVL